MDIALLNTDKSNKITKTDHKSTENQINLFSKTGRKIKRYQTKVFKVTTIHENQISIIITDHNPNRNNSAEDHRTEIIHKVIHKKGIADRIVKIKSIETITKDQTQIEVITQNII